MSDFAPIDLTSMDNTLSQAAAADYLDDAMSVCSGASDRADAPEDEQEFHEFLEFFVTKRRVVDVLWDYILKHNTFVKRWQGRLSRAEARAAEEKRRSEAGEEVIKKDRPRGNYGDVEWACYESWVKAYKADDRTDMIHAIKHAMAAEF